MSIQSRRLMLIACLMGAFAPSAFAADAYPSKPVRVIVPYPAGGSTDSVVRIIMQDIASRWGQPIVIENRAGASGAIGTAVAANSAPDGYTFVAVLNSFTFGPLTETRLAFDPARLTGVSVLVKYPIVLATGATQPWNSFRDFVADSAKRGDGAVAFGSAGHNSHSHVAGEMVAQRTGVKMTHAAYAGDAPRLVDLAEGRIAFGFFGTPFALAQVSAGKLKALVVTGSERSPLLPTVPTVIEQGFPDLVTYGWMGLLAPAGVPDAIQERMASEIAIALRRPEAREKMQGMGVAPAGATPAETRAFLNKETEAARAILAKMTVSN